MLKQIKITQKKFKLNNFLLEIKFYQGLVIIQLL